MKQIINLTQHASTAEQNCLDLQGETLAKLKGLLTFETLPSQAEIVIAAKAIAGIAACMVEIQEANGEVGDGEAMIGGAPFLMAPLEQALRAVGIRPFYAFSVRESVDQLQTDSSIRKVAMFRHLGYVG